MYDEYCDKCYQPFYGDEEMKMQNMDEYDDSFTYPDIRWDESSMYESDMYEDSIYDDVHGQQIGGRRRRPNQGRPGGPGGPGMGGPGGPGPGPGPGNPPDQFPNMPGGLAMPMSPPPDVTPQRSAQLMRVDPGSIRNCMYRFTYIWQNNGSEYWLFPVQLSNTTVAGFRWDRRFGWSYFGVDLRSIEAFMCR